MGGGAARRIFLLAALCVASCDLSGVYDEAAQKASQKAAQMRGDFSSEQDPEKRRILEKLRAKGMSFGSQSNMDIEQARGHFSLPPCDVTAPSCM
tara:strand:+ start:65 stop:349 length:285 start_codon:yes stop_codon:yes gene_type:complete